MAGWEDISPKCPTKNKNAIYVGRTKYSIMMVDIKNPLRKWNITFYDYRASMMSKEEMSNYGNFLPVSCVKKIFNILLCVRTGSFYFKFKW